MYEPAEGQTEGKRPFEKKTLHRTRVVTLGRMGLCLCITALFGCAGPTREIRSHQAAPGDVLVVVDDISVEMTHPFKPGEPNGLFDGGVKINTASNQDEYWEVNAVCSMPDLPNWPQYDNIYGRLLTKGEEPGVEGGATDWQLLLHFEAEPENMGRQTAPLWAQRLADNLCRKGDFSDT